MIALMQMQVGNTYGFQLFMTSDANNYLESQFWGSTDPGTPMAMAPTGRFSDDFFILKNGHDQREPSYNRRRGFELKAP